MNIIGKVAGLLALPPNILAESPIPIRVHYARICAGAAASAGSLSLLWSAHDNSSSNSELAIIPPGAFSPALSDAQEAREAMRARPLAQDFGVIMRKRTSNS